MQEMRALGSSSVDAGARSRALCEQAHVNLRNGDPDLASDCCREALSLDRDCFSAHLLLAGIALPGENYLHLLQRIHKHLEPHTYLEIGVAEGDSITLAGKGTLAIGIDPNPLLKRSLRPSVRVFRETSDEFFAKYNVKAELRGRPLDLAFIDGMHRFEYVLRDFINVESHCHSTSTVLIHDCYPLNEITAARDRVTRFWSGDVWKLVVCLKKYRPDLRIRVLAAPPTGLCVIRGLDRKSTVLRELLDALYQEFVPLPYSMLEPDKRTALNLVTGDWNTMRRLLV